MNLLKKNSDDNIMQSDLNMNNFNINNIKYTIITGSRISNLTVTSTARISNLNVINDAVIERITVNKSQNLTDFDAVNKHYLDSRLQNINTIGGGGKRGVRSEECGKCGVWKVRSVESAECGKCGVRKLWSVETAECGKW